MKERHYFTLYGWDDKKKETIRITNEMSKAIFLTQDRKASDISICDEAKKYFKSKKDIIYFKEQIRKTKYGLSTLSPQVKPSNPALKNVICYIFGEDLDIEDAKDIFDKEYGNLTSQTNNNSIQDPKLYNYCKQWLDAKRDAKKYKDLYEDARKVLFNVPNGTVLQNGNSMCAVLVGFTPSVNPQFDRWTFLKDPANAAYFTKSSSSLKVVVSDGSKEERHSSPNEDPKAYSDDALFEMAKSFNSNVEFNKKAEKEQEEAEKYILGHCKEGTFKLKDLTLTISHMESKPSVNMDKLKQNPELMNKYMKQGSGQRLFTILEIC